MSDLVEQIDALLALNAKMAVSHPIPGLAVELLERARAALTAAFASLPSQGGEWVMVPREPTNEMLAAGSMRTGEQYRAMLSASPSPYGVEGWQDIATATEQTSAPWDGVPVLVVTNHNWGGDSNRVHRARWTDEIHGTGIFGWVVDDCKHGPYPLRGYTLVRHWQPLPAPPPLTKDQSNG